MEVYGLPLGRSAVAPICVVRPGERRQAGQASAGAARPAGARGVAVDLSGDHDVLLGADRLGVVALHVAPKRLQSRGVRIGGCGALPVGVDRLVHEFLQLVLCVVPSLADFGWCAVVEPDVGPVVVVIDVGSDHLRRLVEGLELVAPDAAFSEVANHDSMNAWLSGSR